MRRLFLHIGADKCGSSSLQGYFSNTPRMMQRDGRPLRYVLFKPVGIVGPMQVRQRANRSPLGYVSSDPLKALSWEKPEVTEQVNRFLHRQEGDLITSCEFWLRELPTAHGIERLQQLLVHLDSVELHLICTVRPPLEWLNSAWWQWGAWDNSAIFDSWLDQAVQHTNWDRMLQKVATSLPEAKFHVGCSKPNVINTVLEMIGVDRNGRENTPQINQSLPAAVLRLYQHQPQLRPNPNHCSIDFSALAALGTARSKLEPAPWVINPSKIDSVLQRSADSAERLLGWLSTKEKAKMRADSAWWDQRAYADRTVEDPHEAPIPQLEELCAGVLQAYHDQRLQTLRLTSS